MARILKKNFVSVDEALASLPANTLEHSKRVAEYTEILFLRASASEIYTTDKKAVIRLREDNREAARFAGLYHDIGKAMLPEEYQENLSSYTAEEQALYRSHVSTGAKLIGELVAKNGSGFNANQQRYIVEAVAGHHESWNGEGYPDGVVGKDVSIIGRIVRIADDLDRMACTIHSENPFDDAIEKIKNESGTLYDPLIVRLLPAVRRKLRKVYEANIGFTNTIPDINPFITPKKKGTPVINCLYRPIEKFGEPGTYACEMELRFSGSKVQFTYGEVDTLIKNDLSLRRDIGIYAALDACDMICRMDAAKIPLAFAAVNFPTGWLNSKGAAKEILQALADAALKPERLCVILGKADFSERRVALKDNLAKLREAGVGVMFDRLAIKEVIDNVKPEIRQPEEEEAGNNEQAQPAEGAAEAAAEEAAKARKNDAGIVTVQEIIDLGASIYRLGADDAYALENDAFISAMKELTKAGIALAADDLEREKHRTILSYLQTTLLSGPVRGEYVPENDFFRGELNDYNEELEKSR